LGRLNASHSARSEWLVAVSPLHHACRTEAVAS
jgi:hypothetical protein